MKICQQACASFARAVAMALVISSFASAQFVSVKGKQFVTHDGRPLHLKGINLGNWLLPEGYMFNFKNASSPRLIQTAINLLIGEDEAAKFWQAYRDNYVTRDDVHNIKSRGFNSVRVPFSYRLLVNGTDPVRLEGPGYELLDRVVSWCKAEGLLVILDMHAAPGGQTGDNIDDSFAYPHLYDSAASQELTCRIWRRLAEHYANEPAVLGYDLLNEPVAHYFDVNELNPKLEPLYKKITAEIRQVDRNHIIFLGGAQWDSNFKVFGPPFDNKLAYTFHKYWTETTQSVIQEYVDFGNRYNVPIWMGESGENTDEWITSFRKLLDANDIGWCFWPYKRMDTTRCIVSVKQPTDWKAIIEFADMQATTFEAIREHRPAAAAVKRALDEYIENIKLKNCRTNEGYLKALGLK
jgi:endoglucanase